VLTFFPLSLLRRTSYLNYRLPRWEASNLLVDKETSELIPLAPAIVGSIPVISSGKIPTAWKKDFPTPSTQNVKEALLSELTCQLSKIERAANKHTSQQTKPDKSFVWIKEVSTTPSSVEIQYADNSWVAIDKVESDEELLNTPYPCYLYSDGTILISGVEFSRSVSSNVDGFSFSTDPCFEYLKSSVFIVHPRSKNLILEIEGRDDRYLGCKSEDEVIVLTLYPEAYTSLPEINIKVDGGSGTTAKIQKIYNRLDNFLYLEGVGELKQLFSSPERASILPRAQIKNPSVYLNYVINELTQTNIFQYTEIGGYFNLDHYEYFQEKTQGNWFSYLEGVEVGGSKVYSRYENTWGRVFSSLGEVNSSRSNNEYTVSLKDGTNVVCSTFNLGIKEYIGYIWPINDDYVGERLLFQVPFGVLEKQVFNSKKVVWGNQVDFTDNFLFLNS